MILILWWLLPAGAPEGSRSTDDPPSGVVAELVGYSVEGPDDGRILLLGQGSSADVRLHNAPVARRAAWLLPPHVGRASWAAVPARPGFTLRRLSPTTDDPRVAETSLRPWADDSRLGSFFAGPAEPVTLGCADPKATIKPAQLRQLRVWGLAADRLEEPEVLWLETATRVTASPSEASVEIVSCPQGRAWWTPRDSAAPGDPCAGERDGWKRARPCWIGRSAVCIEPFSRAWGVRIVQSTDERLWTPWSDRFEHDGFAVSLNGPALRRIRVEVDGSALDSSCKGSGCVPETLPVCPAGNGVPLETLGPLTLEDGDLVAIGRTRFLVATAGSRFELLHVRSPRAPGYFKASAGHDVYHPNRRAMWTVPACRDDGADDPLTLAVQAPADRGGEELRAAELALRDAKRRSQIEAAAHHHGIPHEIPAVSSHGVRERALVSLCARFGEKGKIDAVIDATSPRDLRLRTAAYNGALAQGTTEISLGTRRQPQEALVEMDGNLIRVAPTAAPRITRHVRWGLAFYLVFVLWLQAVPLTLARQDRCRRTDWVEEAAWPARLAAPTLQQLAGTGIAVLLFIGASFQLFLALQPELAGKPDYVQAFLQGVVVVSTALLAAAGFAAGGPLASTLPRRAAGATLGASLALLGAAAWWWVDSWGVPEGFWLTALRNEAVASAGASPDDFVALLLKGGGASLALALVLFASGVVPWPRLLEWVARLGLRAPIAGFAVLAAGGLGLGLLQRSALAFELGILAGLAWYAGVYWAFVKSGRRLRDDVLRRRSAAYSLGSGLLILAFLVVFFLVGADLPDALSFVSVTAGLVLTGWAVKIIVTERFTSILRVLLMWALATVFGAAFASLLLTDMGSVAAWIPAVLAGLFLWLVRPEEHGGRGEDPRKAFLHFLLALGLGLMLLGVLDVFKNLVQGLEWQALDRPRQRLDLAEDVSYITAGEWITQVRWLASHQDGDFQWVPNVNSDVAIFGLAAGVATWLAVVASLLVLGVAGCAGLAADQALREGRAAAGRSGSDRLRPALFRGLGLLTGMVSVLLISQWLVHLATGVVLHLPITGLVFPWISHGNTTHLLYAAAIVAPMAAITALGARGGDVPNSTRR